MKLFLLKTEPYKTWGWPLPADSETTSLRTFAVACVAALAALLHGVAIIWYLQRPVPLPLTGAKPLPMIDITLAAPAVQQTATPPIAEPVEPPKPKPVIKPKVKPAAKPITKPKVTSEIKKKRLEPKSIHKPEPVSAESSPPLNQSAPPVTAPSKTFASTPKSAPQAPLRDTPANANAAYLNNPAPAYPRLAKQRHWQGRVLLRVLVTADGRCGDLSIAHSSGHDVLDEAAIEAVRHWRFVPGKHGDTPVSSWVNVPIEFALE